MVWEKPVSDIHWFLPVPYNSQTLDGGVSIPVHVAKLQIVYGSKMSNIAALDTFAIIFTCTRIACKATLKEGQPASSGGEGRASAFPARPPPPTPNQILPMESHFAKFNAYQS